MLSRFGWRSARQQCPPFAWCWKSAANSARTEKVTWWPKFRGICFGETHFECFNHTSTVFQPIRAVIMQNRWAPCNSTASRPTLLLTTIVKLGMFPDNSEYHSRTAQSKWMKKPEGGVQLRNIKTKRSLATADRESVEDPAKSGSKPFVGNFLPFFVISSLFF